MTDAINTIRKASRGADRAPLCSGYPQPVRENTQVLLARQSVSGRLDLQADSIRNQ